MAYTIEVILKNGQKTQITYDRNPNICPICHNNIQPKRVVGGLADDSTIAPLQMVYKCPNEECFGFFVATYHHQRISQSEMHYLHNTAPRTPEKVDWGMLLKIFLQISWTYTTRLWLQNPIILITSPVWV